MRGNPEASQQHSRVGSVQDTWLSGLEDDLEQSRKCVMHHLAYALPLSLYLPLALPRALTQAKEKDNAANRAQAARLGSVFAQITAAKRTRSWESAAPAPASHPMAVATCGNATKASRSRQIDYSADYQTISRFP